MTMDKLDKVWEIKALVKMNKSDEAKKLLDRLANICAPIMAKRNWRVKCLKEFFPKNAGLLGLNVNKGVSIFIRLRPSHDKDSFYPWDHILGTMVHELTHNAVSSHSAEFYKLMDQVHDEVEKSAGPAGTEKASLTNAVFTTESHLLGGSVGFRKGNSSKAAADAAVRRAKNATLSTSSGQKLGGSLVSYTQLSAAERRLLAADAAERRLKDDLWCHDDAKFDDDDDDDIDAADGSQHVSKANGFNDTKSHSKENRHNNENYQVWICNGCSASNNLNNRQCERCLCSRNIKKDTGIVVIGSMPKRSEAKLGNQNFAGCSCNSGSHDTINSRFRKIEEKREQQTFLCGHCTNGNVEDLRGMKKKIKTEINIQLRRETGTSIISVNGRGTGSSSVYISKKGGNINSVNSSSSSSSSSSSVVIDLAGSDSDDNDNGSDFYNVKANNLKEKLSANDDDDDAIVLGRQKPPPKYATASSSNHLRC